MVLYGFMNNWDNHGKVGFLWLGGKERKGFFTPLVSCAAPRLPENPERRGFPCGRQSLSVWKHHSGGIFGFRRSLGFRVDCYIIWVKLLSKIGFR